jgi:hypothetical protein
MKPIAKPPAGMHSVEDELMDLIEKTDAARSKQAPRPPGKKGPPPPLPREQKTSPG